MGESERFVDAQRMHKEHSATFRAPDQSRLSSIGPGDYVKVCAESERFWTRVTKITTDARGVILIEATVENALLNTAQHGLDLGNVIVFEPRHAYDVVKNPSRLTPEEGGPR